MYVTPQLENFWMDSIWQLAKMVFLASIYKGPLQMSGRDI